MQFRGIEIIGLMLFFIAIGLCFDYEFTYSHELAHKQIYKYYGIDSNMTVRMFGDSFVLGNITQIRELYEDDPEAFYTMLVSQNMVDVIGYQLQPFIWLIVICSFIISMLLLMVMLKLADLEETIIHESAYLCCLNHGGRYGVEKPNGGRDRLS